MQEKMVSVNAIQDEVIKCNMHGDIKHVLSLAIHTSYIKDQEEEVGEKKTSLELKFDKRS